MPLRPGFYAAVESRYRVGPEIWNQDVKRYLTKDRDGRIRNYVLNADSTLNAVAHFHDDVSRSEAERILRAHARKVAPLSSLRWRVAATGAQIKQLAAMDAVRWIGLPGIPIFGDNDHTRQTINVESLQNFDNTTGQVQGLGGAGITIGVFDLGIDETHADFGNRVIVNDAGMAAHATHVAGVIAGDGRKSKGSDSFGQLNQGTEAYQWRGMAPQAQLIDADGNTSNNAATLFGYIHSDGMDISNHSYTYSLDGVYGDIDTFHDLLMRGDALNGTSQIPPRLHVYSSGNSGSYPSNHAYGEQELGYFSLSKQSKNGLMVGNFDPFTPQINPTSSLGPAHDGRIKPDVVAPGTTITSTGYCKRSSGADPWAQCAGHPVGAERHNFYHTIDGTSDAAAAVTGMLALVLQQFATSYAASSPGWVLLPSTLRALTMQSAHDISGPVWFSNEDGPVQAFAGPDFVTGYGMVDAKDAVDLIIKGEFGEDVMAEECDVHTWWVSVPAGSAQLKVTLTWDDWPADDSYPIYSPHLVNDLDLELIPPSSPTVYYPWLLDQVSTNSAGSPLADGAQVCGSDITVQRTVSPVSAPAYYSAGNVNNVNEMLSGGVLKAASHGKDHLNNTEQVVIDAPVNGWWRIHVTGFKVPKTPQTFSLAASQRLYAMLPIAPLNQFCWSSPACRPIFYYESVCERFPAICGPILIRPGHLEVSFRQREDAVFIPVNVMCRALVKCPPCLKQGFCHNLEFTFGNLDPDFRVSVYDAQGAVRYSDSSNRRSKRVAVPSGPTKRYIMVIQGSHIRPGQVYDFRASGEGAAALWPEPPSAR